MRAIATSVIMLVALAACSALPPPSRSSSPYAPLRAWISTPGSFGGVSFQINRPAHVAVFEIIPGRGIVMLHPSYTTGETYLAAGMHSVWTGLQAHRWGYFPDLGGYGSQQPRFLYLVASEAPLRIAEFRGSPMALRSAMSWQHFTAWNPYAAMGELTRLILPEQDWGEWATDLYVQWPDPASRLLAVREQPRLVMVTCRDGRHILVPIGYSFTACPREGAGAPPTDGGDTEEIRTPTRRRPEPTTATGEERTADWPRARTDAGEEQPERPIRPRRRPIGETEGQAGERERPRPAPTREGEQPRAEPRRTEPRPEPRRAEPRAEPRREARPAPSSSPAPASQPRRDPPARSSGSSEPREHRSEPQAQPR